MRRRIARASLPALALLALAIGPARANQYDALVLSDPFTVHYWNGTSTADLGPGAPSPLTCGAGGTCTYNHAFGIAAPLIAGWSATPYLTASGAFYTGGTNQPAFWFSWWTESTQTAIATPIVVGNGLYNITNGTAGTCVSGSSGTSCVYLNGTVTSFDQTTNAATYSDGHPHFFAVSCSSTSPIGTGQSDCTMYADGVAQTGGVETFNGYVITSPATISLSGDGIAGGAGTFPFVGLMGAVAFGLGEQLSQGQVSALYSCGTGVTCSPTQPPGVAVFQ